jgi:3-deoxy-D-manno-octulosonic-acid transferase
MIRAAYHTLTRLSTLLPLRTGKLGRSLRGRSSAAHRWSVWAASRPEAPLLWVHGASVGELLTADPIIARLRAARSSLSVAFSFSSPSAADWRARFPATHADFAPTDTPEDTARVLDASRPACLVLARGDLWPEMVRQAALREIPVAIVGGTVRPASHRLLRPLRSLYAEALRRVSWIGAVTQADADRWGRLGAPEHCIEVSGDPRHDQVLERPTDLTILSPLLPWADGRPVLVAGSVEPSDERVLFDAMHTALSARDDIRILLVPHDPSPRTLDRLRSSCAARGIAAEPLASGCTAPAVPCLVAGGTGLLYHLYALASVAYVGGGFSRSGLHAVIEPAAYGIPILTGPHVSSSPDAERLQEARGLVSAADAGTLAAQWLEWMRDNARRWSAGCAARACLSAGAAEISARRIGEVIDGRTGGATALRPLLRRSRSGGPRARR